jgi:hypothetical protein
MAGEVLTIPQLLALLPVRRETADREYDRSFFLSWVDDDGDGCDTRQEVLIEEAVAPPSVGEACSLTGGSWLSYYDGISTRNINDLQVDHVVALAEAWSSGASEWTAARRAAFANDLDVGWALAAVSVFANVSKSDSDPADWLPPLAAARCRYVADWVAVKARWGLSVDAAEHRALATAIGPCTEMRPFVPVQ